MQHLDYHWTDRLIELVERKAACLESLRTAGRRQLATIEDGELADLLALLGGKQRLLSELDRVESQLAPYREQSPDDRCWRSETLRRRCGEMLGQCQSLLAEIVEQERHSEQMLRVRRDEAASRLEAAHYAVNARGAYQAGAAEHVHQLDLSSET